MASPFVTNQAIARQARRGAGPVLFFEPYLNRQRANLQPKSQDQQNRSELVIPGTLMILKRYRECIRRVLCALARKPSHVCVRSVWRITSPGGGKLLTPEGQELIRRLIRDGLLPYDI